MNLNERLKAVRKSLHPKTSQEKFGEILGVSRNAVKTYELGTVIPNETFIQLLCTKFNISENWLRTGEGPMYVESESSTLTQVTNLLKLDDTEQKFLAAYLNLPPELKKNLKETCRQVVDFYSSQNETATTSSAKNGEIEKELAAYRAELEAESRGKILPLSENTEKGRSLA